MPIENDPNAPGGETPEIARQQRSPAEVPEDPAVRAARKQTHERAVDTFSGGATEEVVRHAAVNAGATTNISSPVNAGSETPNAQSSGIGPLHVPKVEQGFHERWERGRKGVADFFRSRSSEARTVAGGVGGATVAGYGLNYLGIGQGSLRAARYAGSLLPQAFSLLPLAPATAHFWRMWGDRRRFRKDGVQSSFEQAVRDLCDRLPGDAMAKQQAALALVNKIKECCHKREKFIDEQGEYDAIKLIDEARLIDPNKVPYYGTAERYAAHCFKHLHAVLTELQNGTSVPGLNAAIGGELKNILENGGREKIMNRLAEISAAFGRAIAQDHMRRRDTTLLAASGGTALPASYSLYQAGAGLWLLAPLAAALGYLATRALKWRSASAGQQMRYKRDGRLDDLDPAETIAADGTCKLYQQHLLRECPADMPLRTSEEKQWEQRIKITGDMLKGLRVYPTVTILAASLARHVMKNAAQEAGISPDEVAKNTAAQRVYAREANRAYREYLGQKKEKFAKLGGAVTTTYGWLQRPQMHRTVAFLGGGALGHSIASTFVSPIASLLGAPPSVAATVSFIVGGGILVKLYNSARKNFFGKTD